MTDTFKEKVEKIQNGTTQRENNQRFKEAMGREMTPIEILVGGEIEDVNSWAKEE